MAVFDIKYKEQLGIVSITAYSRHSNQRFTGKMAKSGLFCKQSFEDVETLERIGEVSIGNPRSVQSACQWMIVKMRETDGRCEFNGVGECFVNESGKQVGDSIKVILGTIAHYAEKGGDTDIAESIRKELLHHAFVENVKGLLGD